MTSARLILRGPILAPQRDGSVRFIADGLIVSGDRGRIEWVGEFAHFARPDHPELQRSRGVICPPFFDDHIHVPQHPIRGRFMEGVGAKPPSGRLIAGLNKNVFPAESKCADRAYAEECVRAFLEDTLAHGVVGGCAYMTVHPAATRVALEILPPSWSVGLVAMERNCPEYLRNDLITFDRDCEQLARDFGRRFVATDRFAVAVDTELRKRVVACAEKFNLRTQTHLNEQVAEKRFVEQALYPGTSYTEVYHRDGLLDHDAILGHCIHMTEPELDIVAQTKSTVAHCPVSNTLLASGVMPLDAIVDHGIDYAICTDVGASPTTSLLCDMAQFLKVHAGRSRRATPSEALYRTTLAAARIMQRDDEFGRLEVGRPFSVVEIDPGDVDVAKHGADDVIARALLGLDASELGQYRNNAALSELATGRLDAGKELDWLEADAAESVRRVDAKVQRVIVRGQTVWERRA